MTVLITGTSGSGKTVEILKRISERKRGYMVCMNRDEVDRVMRTIRGLGIDVPMPITFDQVMRRDFNSRGVRELWFDNLDILVSRLLAEKLAGCPIAGVSLGCASDWFSEIKDLGARPPCSTKTERAF